MSCPDCEARRRAFVDAAMRRNVVEATKQAAKGAAELIGVKTKTAVAEQAAAKNQEAKNHG